MKAVLAVAERVLRADAVLSVVVTGSGYALEIRHCRNRRLHEETAPWKPSRTFVAMVDGF